MRNPPSFSTLVSQMLVAVTIEVDNAWEHRFWIHADPQPLRTSLVMWANFLRFVGKDGITLRDLSRRAGFPSKKAHPDLAGMVRWRYVTVEPGAGRATQWDQVIRPTRVGEQAAAAWAPLPDEIEARWGQRYGTAAIQRLREALLGVLQAVERPLPHYYSVLDHKRGMRTLDPVHPDCDALENLALPFLLSQVSQRFAMDFERNSSISLALRANVIRVLTAEPIAKRDLPRRAGISKEALSMGINFLKKKGILVEEPVTDGRGKAVRLTTNGLALQAEFGAAVARLEDAWKAAYTAERINVLHEALMGIWEREGRLLADIVEYPEGWRASHVRPDVLPHHPMVLYRGGWPDGS